MARTVEDRFEKPDFKGFLDLVGVQNFVDQVGANYLFEALGADRVVHEIATDSFINTLTPEQREELRRRLQ